MYKKLLLTIVLLTSFQSGHLVAMNDSAANHWSLSDCLKGAAAITVCYGVISVYTYYCCSEQAYELEVDARALKRCLSVLRNQSEPSIDSGKFSADEIPFNELNRVIKKACTNEGRLTKKEKELCVRYNPLELNKRNKQELHESLLHNNILYEKVHTSMATKNASAWSNENYMQSRWYHSYLFSSSMTPRELAYEHVKNWKEKNSNWWKQPVVMQCGYVTSRE